MTRLYNMPLVQNNGTIVKILVIGMVKIKESLEAVNHKFPKANRDNLIWPIGQVEGGHYAEGIGGYLNPSPNSWRL